MKILDNGKTVDVLDLGMVKVGETKEYKYTLENETKYDNIEIEIVLRESDGKIINEVNIQEYPKELKAYERGELKFSWSPSVEIKTGLKTQLKIKALEIWR